MAKEGGREGWKEGRERQDEERRKEGGIALLPAVEEAREGSSRGLLRL